MEGRKNEEGPLKKKSGKMTLPPQKNFPVTPLRLTDSKRDLKDYLETVVAKLQERLLSDDGEMKERRKKFLVCSSIHDGHEAEDI